MLTRFDIDGYSAIPFFQQLNKYENIKRYENQVRLYTLSIVSSPIGSFNSSMKTSSKGVSASLTVFNFMSNAPTSIHVNTPPLMLKIGIEKITVNDGNFVCRQCVVIAHLGLHISLSFP